QPAPSTGQARCPTGTSPRPPCPTCALSATIPRKEPRNGLLHRRTTNEETLQLVRSTVWPRRRRQDSPSTADDATRRCPLRRQRRRGRHRQRQLALLRGLRPRRRGRLLVSRHDLAQQLQPPTAARDHRRGRNQRDHLPP